MHLYSEVSSAVFIGTYFQESVYKSAVLAMGITPAYMDAITWCIHQVGFSDPT